MTLKEMRRHLKRHGFYDAPVNNRPMDPLTEHSIVAFKRSVGLRARPYVGPITRTALREGAVDFPRKAAPDAPPHLRIAYGYLGLKEIPGPRHNADIVGFWERLGLHFRDDETPWCAGYVNACLHKANLPITPKYRAAALGWRWTGYGTRLDGPALGAVLSMKRPGRPGSGHMTFVAGRTESGMIAGLGGNQGNEVGIDPYHPTARDAQYHWPEGSPVPVVTGLDTLPLVDASGRVLTNEA